jgi:YVTN family beta-propeller protein
VVVLGFGTATAATAVANPAPPIAYRVYVSNEGSGDVSVIDGRRREVIATIPLGKRPRGIAADSTNQRLFVALSGSPLAGPGVEESGLPPADRAADGIGVLDTVSLRIVKVLSGVSDPEQIAVSANGRRLYVASEDTGQAVAIDIGSGNVLGRVLVGAEPEGIAVHPIRGIAYVSSEASSSVAIVDMDTLQVVRTVPVGERPREVAVSTDGTRAYVTGENDASLVVLDGQTDTPILRVHVPGDGARPKGVVVSHDGKRVYVSTGRGGELVAFDARTLAVLGAVRVGARPWGLALSPDDLYLFAADGPSDEISVVATDSLRVEATIRVGKRPWGVAVSPIE